MSDPGENSYETRDVRIDKWLWAARFYKTRALAIQAVELGKVTINGERTKPAKSLHVGDSGGGARAFPAPRPGGGRAKSLPGDGGKHRRPRGGGAKAAPRRPAGRSWPPDQA